MISVELRKKFCIEMGDRILVMGANERVVAPFGKIRRALTGRLNFFGGKFEEVFARDGRAETSRKPPNDG